MCGVSRAGRSTLSRLCLRSLPPLPLALPVCFELHCYFKSVLKLSQRESGEELEEGEFKGDGSATALLSHRTPLFLYKQTTRQGVKETYTIRIEMDCVYGCLREGERKERERKREDERRKKKVNRDCITRTP